ncbi:hypothetical protein LTR86_010458 [Recurvomyces mirabilis]|nr:hypothetical protein LTR86_010458 [Recurvomyces mirabilis]
MWEQMEKTVASVWDADDYPPNINSNSSAYTHQQYELQRAGPRHSAAPRAGQPNAECEASRPTKSTSTTVASATATESVGDLPGVSQTTPGEEPVVLPPTQPKHDSTHIVLPTLNSPGGPDTNQNFSRNLIDVAMPNVLYFIYHDSERERLRKVVLNLATVHAVAIHDAQRDLATSAAELVRGDMLRDLDYMEEKAKKGYDADPFLLQTDKQLERDMMLEAGVLDVFVITDLPDALDHDQPRLSGMGRNARQRQEKARNRSLAVACALAGGRSLLVPMIIMSLVPGLTCQLVTTSVFVLAFALGGALFSELKPAEILAVAAGYAAVLVVFVGSSEATSS